MALFNLRVYGILLDADNRLLVSDEFIRGAYITKLPGGGLEIGEGTRACVAREFMEETGLTVTVGEHLYTTDFFQISAFNNVDQIISIYYWVHCDQLEGLKTSETAFDFAPEQVTDNTTCAETFRWIEWAHLNANAVTLPIDKVAIAILKEKHTPIQSRSSL